MDGKKTLLISFENGNVFGWNTICLEAAFRIPPLISMMWLSLNFCMVVLLQQRSFLSLTLLIVGGLAYNSVVLPPGV